MIEINHLTKKFGKHVAVDDLSLTIEPGRIYGFLGPNGAGKSTTMNMITGYLGATNGSIKINGHDIFAEPEEAKKCVGYLPEQPPLYQDMTVEEYLKFVSELKKIPKDKRKQYIKEAMEMTMITDVKGRLIKNLSKGYRQRVGFAQAILGYPEVIILDEPTVGLDPKQIIEVRDLIRKLGEKHVVILSSHILSEVREVCDYVFIIARGKLVASDTTENLLKGGEEKLQIRMLLKGSQEAVERTFSACDFVDEYQIGKTDKEDTYRVVLTLSETDEVREEIAKHCAQDGLLILETQAEKKSLEEVFLTLTNVAGLADEETEADEEVEE
ncbi:MAG: ABC transporter ATP-binding protein [Lachnospiraceae bacterium]|nr:ABC transporter ATP-binding protein [Lachnospiraceae bacterium]